MICEEDGNFLGFHDKDFIESHKKGDYASLRERECFITMKRKAMCI